MLVFQYNSLPVLLFVVILNCETASEVQGIREGRSGSGMSVEGGGVGTGGFGGGDWGRSCIMSTN